MQPESAYKIQPEEPPEAVATRTIIPSSVNRVGNLGINLSDSEWQERVAEYPVPESIMNGTCFGSFYLILFRSQAGVEDVGRSQKLPTKNA